MGSEQLKMPFAASAERPSASSAVRLDILGGFPLLSLYFSMLNGIIAFIITNKTGGLFSF